MRGEEGEVPRAIGLDHDRRREAAVDRQDRPLGDAVEHDFASVGWSSM